MLSNKFYFIFIFCFFIGIITRANELFPLNKKIAFKVDTSLTVNAQADSLRKYGDLILINKGKKRIEYEILFFKYFPDNFQRFDLLYDFKDVSLDSTVFMPLYSSSHIEKILPNLDSVNRVAYYTKLIKVSIGGDGIKEQADVLQDLLIKKVRSNLILTVKILNTLNNQQIQSFWLFFFDMENPSAVDFSFLNKIKDKRIVRLMKQSRREDIIKWSKE